MMSLENRNAALAEIQNEQRAGKLVAAPVGRPPEDRSARNRWSQLLGGEGTRTRAARKDDDLSL